MKSIVSDSSPLIALSRIDQLKLLPQLFDAILIPQAVAEEVFPKGKRKKGATALRAAGWLITQDLRDPHSLDVVSPALDVGERAAVALAYEQNCGLLVDEVAGKQEAQRLGVKAFGTLAVLLDAKAQGLVPAVKPLLQALRREGFWLSAKLIQDVLQRAQESPKRPRA